MSEASIAENESLFRSVNEVEELEHPSLESGSQSLTFVCECADTSCREPIEMTRAEYERVRCDPRQFAIVLRHVDSEAEEVVWRNDDYAVVRKHGEAGAVAEALDPRS